LRHQADGQLSADTVEKVGWRLQRAVFVEIAKNRIGYGATLR